jgi:hypothetical protein
MGFFTNNWGMADAFSDPQVGRTRQMTPGAGALSSTQNLNPTQWYPNQQQQSQRQTNWGAPNPQQPQQQSGQFNNFQDYNQPWWMLNRNQPPTKYQQRGVTGENLSSDSYEDSGYSGPGADLSQQGYQDYLNSGRGMLQGLGGLLGPVGGLFGLAADYNYGYNAYSPNRSENRGFQNPLTGNYQPFYNDNYQGPGSGSFPGMNPGEQWDMLLNQQSYDPYSNDGQSGGLQGLLSGLFGFGGNQLNYDPDLDLDLNDDGTPWGGWDDDDGIDWSDPDDFGDDDFDGNGFDDDGFDDDGWGGDDFGSDGFDGFDDDDGDW